MFYEIKKEKLLTGHFLMNKPNVMLSAKELKELDKPSVTSLTAHFYSAFVDQEPLTFLIGPNYSIVAIITPIKHIIL